MHLLIVDDDQDAARSMAAVLELMVAPVQISLACDGVEAVETATSASSVPDAVVTDIEMPRMDGVTAASKIRRALGAATPLLIAMTGHAALTTNAAITDAFDHVLRKPVDLDALAGLLLAIPAKP